MLKVGKDVVSNLDGLASLLKNQNATSGGGNIIDILSSIWVSNGKVFVSEDHINFSHIEVVGFTLLGHETSPGTKEFLWGDVSTLSITGLFDVTLLLSLDTSQCLWITFEKIWLWCATVTSLTS